MTELLLDAAALDVAIFAVYALVALIFKLPLIPVSVAGSAVNVDARSVAAILLISIAMGLKLGKWLEFGSLFRILRGEVVTRPSDTDTRLRARVRRAAYRVLGRGTMVNRWLRHTRGTGRDTVWEDVFAINPTPIVAVTLEDGTRVVGRCKHFSASSDRPELLIAAHNPTGESFWPKGKVLFIDPSGTQKWKEVAGVYLGRESKIVMVEFLGTPEVDW